MTFDNPTCDVWSRNDKIFDFTLSFKIWWISASYLSLSICNVSLCLSLFKSVWPLSLSLPPHLLFLFHLWLCLCLTSPFKFSLCLLVSKYFSPLISFLILLSLKIACIPYNLKKFPKKLYYYLTSNIWIAKYFLKVWCNAFYQHGFMLQVCYVQYWICLLYGKSIEPYP